MAKTQSTLAEFKPRNHKKRLCLSGLDGYVQCKKAEVSKTFYIPHEATSREPQACLYVPEGALQVRACDRQKLALVLPMRRPTGASLRSCGASSFSFLCNHHFPVSVASLIYSLSRFEVVGVTVPFFCSVWSFSHVFSSKQTCPAWCAT